MLQSVRDNLKGTVAIFILAIFIIPLILFGVEELFVGSVGGTDVASVNGEGIHRAELQRELALEKQQLQQRFELEANSPQLDDSVLTGPVLQRMTHREALYQAATRGGMGASRDELWKQIAGIGAFQVDGKFDYQVFKDRISFLYTPATFLEASEKDFVLGHLNAGISTSGFVTESEAQLLAAITQQKRTFYAIELPATRAESINVSAAEIDEYYAANQQQFVEQEKVSVEYLELTLESLAEKAEVTEADIKNVYEQEISDFKSEPRYIVAHILLEKDAGHDAAVKEITEKLAAGQEFSELAKIHSDDMGSKNNGGALGEMVEDTYPKEFVAAVKKLDVAGVSGPITTDAGTHFIKLVEKTNVEPPSFEERKSTIRNQLAREIAQEAYLQKIALLDEKTFGADSLKYAAEALGVEVQSSEFFTKFGGNGIAAEQKIVEAAFAPDVLTDGHNSRVLELAGSRALVIRLKEHQPERIKPLAEVKEQIQRQLTEQKIVADLKTKAAGVIAKISAGESPDKVAKDAGLEYKRHDQATRSSFDVNQAVLQKVFSLARPTGDSPVIEQVQLPTGGVAVVGLEKVENGTLADMEEAQRSGLHGQLEFQISQAELFSFETGIIEKAKIKLSK